MPAGPALLSSDVRGGRGSNLAIEAAITTALGTVSDDSTQDLHAAVTPQPKRPS